MPLEGTIAGINGNLIVAETTGQVVQNSIGYCLRGDGARLLSEVIRIRGRQADLQVFEETGGLRVGDRVEFHDTMLSVALGPGLLGSIFDGLQNPLPRLAQEVGYFLEPGRYLHGLRADLRWPFTPVAAAGDPVAAGDTLGTVPEGIFSHRIMVPFALGGHCTVEHIAEPGDYTIEEPIATLMDEKGQSHPVRLQQPWPVKLPLSIARRRLIPREPLVTRVRIIDTMFPVAQGGTYCIPGPFGAGKTVLQQIISRHAEIDVVIIAACGERAGEVVETLQAFPELTDPRTGRSLMERTIITCNTSAMPVAAREASVYTSATFGEYYRQMGLNVLMIADSTSRWAQAMREISGRLEEIPGEEAFPAYLESRIAAFYERAGALELADGRIGTLTIGGTVSPAGGNFEEPVTQATLKVVGAFHGLSRARSDAQRYPAIDPLESWSRYEGIVDAPRRERARAILLRGEEIRQMMTVIGEEGVSINDLVITLKADLFDTCFLQQNAYDAVDAATPVPRQQLMFDRLLAILELPFHFEDKEQARSTMIRLTELIRNWNTLPEESDDYRIALDAIASAITRIRQD